MILVGNMMFGMMAGIYTGYADMMTTGSSSYVYYMKSGKALDGQDGHDRQRA